MEDSRHDQGKRAAKLGRALATYQAQLTSMICCFSLSTSTLLTRRLTDTSTLPYAPTPALRSLEFSGSKMRMRSECIAWKRRARQCKLGH